MPKKKYLDFTMEKDQYNKSKNFLDEDAICIAIKNIFLSRPGNFLFNPSIGMNLQKYRFEFLDDSTIENIRNELNRQISKFIPSIENVNVLIDVIRDDNETPYLCISIGANINEHPTEMNFILVKNEEDVLQIFNESRRKRK